MIFEGGFYRYKVFVLGGDPLGLISPLVCFPESPTERENTHQLSGGTLAGAREWR